MASLINDVVRDLEQHKNALRIRKMLFCATRNQWENDRDILLSLSLRDLVEEVVDLNSTLDQLTISLHEIVKSLNRQTEYLLVANTIISSVGKLYDDGEDATHIIAFKPQERNELDERASDSTVQTIARALEAESEVLRVRKLLYCLCHNRWSNDTEDILAIRLTELVEGTYQLFPNLKQLGLSLQGIVDSLNRKTEYSSVANTILHRFEQLYGDSPSDIIDTTTGIGDRANSEEPDTGATQQLPPTAPVQIDPNEISSNPQEFERSPDSLDEFNARIAETGNTYDPFAVRLETIKYSNPLRAKILIFSTLEHRFDYKGKDWSSLRTIELDELLLSVYQKYKTFESLEARLYEVAETLDDQNESFQAASAVAKALKPFYR